MKDTTAGTELTPPWYEQAPREPIELDAQPSLHTAAPKKTPIKIRVDTNRKTEIRNLYLYSMGSPWLFFEVELCLSGISVKVLQLRL